MLAGGNQHQRVDDVVAGEMLTIVLVEGGLITVAPAIEFGIEDAEPRGPPARRRFWLGNRVPVVERGKTAFGVALTNVGGGVFVAEHGIDRSDFRGDVPRMFGEPGAKLFAL